MATAIALPLSSNGVRWGPGCTRAARSNADLRSAPEQAWVRLLDSRLGFRGAGGGCVVLFGVFGVSVVKTPRWLFSAGVARGVNARGPWLLGLALFTQAPRPPQMRVAGFARVLRFRPQPPLVDPRLSAKTTGAVPGVRQ